MDFVPLTTMKWESNFKQALSSIYGSEVRFAAEILSGRTERYRASFPNTRDLQQF